VSYEGRSVPHLVRRIKFTLTSHGWSDVTSLNNQPRINQCRQVEADNVYLQFGAIVVLDHRANDGILDFAVVRVHADSVADLKLAIGFPSWHARNVPFTRRIFQGLGPGSFQRTTQSRSNHPKTVVSTVIALEQLRNCSGAATLCFREIRLGSRTGDPLGRLAHPFCTSGS